MIQELPLPKIPGDKMIFTPIETICSGNLNPNRLLDVVGVISRVGKPSDISKNPQFKSWLIKLELSVEGSCIECSLFDNYYQELQDFIDQGQQSNVVLAIQNAKINVWEGRIGLQSIRGGTKLVFNCKSPEALELTSSFINKLDTPSQPLTQMPFTATVSIEKDMLNTPRKSVYELQDLKKGTFAMVVATVKHLTGNHGWWYMACNECTGGVHPDNKMYFCDRCYHHVIAVGPRYRIRIKVEDTTDDATFVIFDREATTLFGKSCSDMIDSVKEEGGVLPTPPEIQMILGKKYLFKVQFKPPTNSAFEISYNVKKMSDDEGIIKKFQEQDPKKG